MDLISIEALTIQELPVADPVGNDDLIAIGQGPTALRKARIADVRTALLGSATNMATATAEAYAAAELANNAAGAASGAASQLNAALGQVEGAALSANNAANFAQSAGNTATTKANAAEQAAEAANSAVAGASAATSAAAAAASNAESKATLADQKAGEANVAALAANSAADSANTAAGSVNDGLSQLQGALDQVAGATSDASSAASNADAKAALADQSTIHANSAAVAANTAANTANAAAASVNDGLAQLDDGLDQVANLSAVSAKYSQGGDVKDLGVNAASTQNLVFPNTAAEELINAYTGGNPDGALPNQVSTDLAQCQIGIPTQEATSFVFPTVPFLNTGNGSFRTVPVSFQTILYNQPIGIPLFKPTRTNGFGFLTWQYIGDEPLYTTIQGSVELALRVSTADSGVSANVILRLVPISGVPNLELGQDNGIRSIGTSNLAAMDTAKRFNDNPEFYDLCGDVPANYNDLIVGNDLYTGSLPGFFNAETPTDALETISGGNPVGPEVQSTDWIDVSHIDFSLRSLLFDISGTSTRSRIRWKDAGGNVFYSAQQSINANSRRIFRLPNAAQQVQIYYTGAGTTAASGTIHLYEVDTSDTAQIDPCRGFYVTKSISAQRDVVFWPGGEYLLDLATSVYGAGAGLREWGHRFTSGGLSFFFDAGRMRKKLAANFFV